MTRSEPDISRYSRQTILPDLGADGQRKLKNATVLIVGAGGLGVPVAMYLAGAGVGKLIIADGDTVSLSNLHRQVLYNESELGAHKAILAQKKLSALNRDIEVVAFTHRLDRANIEDQIQKADVVVDGSDNFETRYLVNDACVLLKRPLVYGAVNKLEGQVAVFNIDLGHGKRSVNYRDLFPEIPEPGSVMNCEQAGVLGPVPGIVGSVMATETIKTITGTGELLTGRMLHIDAGNMTFREIKLAPESTVTISGLPESGQYCLVENRLLSWSDIKPELHYLVDVRQPEERERFHAGGVLIPLSELENRLDILPEDKAVVFYCRTGVRSDLAVQILARHSARTDVYSVAGGIFSHSDYQG